MKLDPVDLPIILLYNLDRSWPPVDIRTTIDLAEGLANGLSKQGHPVELACLEDDRLEKVLSSFDPDRYIIFNWCEEIPGIPRSSWMVARALESLGFIFIGADSQALRFSQDKPAVKEQLFRKHIPTPGWKVYRGDEKVFWDCFPAIVKPAFEHYSCGITHQAVVHNNLELSTRIRQVTEEFRQPVLVEDFIDGREFHVSVVGNGKLQVFPIAEMDFSIIQEDSGRVCTYDSKFSPGSPDYELIQVRLPASLSSEKRTKIEKTAIEAYRATRCRDYARLDIRERNDAFYVLDVNPNADISPDTSLTLSAELAGYSQAQFGSLLVQLAAHRHPLLKRKENSRVRPSIPATEPTD